MGASRSSLLSTPVAITLHWLIAAIVLFELPFGYYKPPLKGFAVPLHFVLGISVLVLTALLLAWRCMHRSPPLPIEMPAWQRTAVRTVDGLVYFMLFAMPTMGWLIVSAHPWPAGGGENILGWFILPPIRFMSSLEQSFQVQVHTLLVQVHAKGGWVFFGLLVLHIVGALKVQLYDRQTELAHVGMGKLN